jgi:REP element-mobilizing transposase RayT
MTQIISEARAVPQSLAKIYVHIVFSTKHRQPFLGDKKVRAACHAYLAGTCKARGSPSLIVGGVADHVHILCTLSREESIAVLVRELKRESSKAMKEKAPDLRAFYWQSGYGAFSVSPSHVALLKDYIANQEEHHRQESFQDEFRRLLKKYGVAYDEKHVWD